MCFTYFFIGLYHDLSLSHCTVLYLFVSVEFLLEFTDLYCTNVKKIETELYSDDLIQKYFFF